MTSRNMAPGTGSVKNLRPMGSVTSSIQRRASRGTALSGRVPPLAALFVAIAIAGCRREAPTPTMFERLAPETTGVTFRNDLPETAFNILNYLYYYNGGGVAVGDV